MSIRATISKEFEFCAAHHLTALPEGHPCSRVHGHTWKVVVEVHGKVLEDGFVMDFRDLSKVVAPLISQLDHGDLNETIPNPTSEALCAWFLVEISRSIRNIKAIEIWESPRSKCRMEIEDILEES
jgi:6-pyruvoyltetrahydropterin/6-carboxytetrahydropterin synthase